MKPIRIALWLVIALPALLWLVTDRLWPTPFSYFAFRAAFIQFSGAIAIVVMSIAMLLALRSRRIETWLNGLDKAYRLHKWLGIATLLIATAHWWFAQGTKWMVGWGWLARPQRRSGDAGGTGAAADAVGQAEAWLRGQRGLAEDVGEWAFYALALLIVLALVKRFPYRLFAKTHSLIALAYLALVYHSIVLLRFDHWAQPLGGLMAVSMLAGSAAALIALGGRIGARHRYHAEVASLEYHPDMRVLEIGLRLEPGWPGHEAGQFAFATSDAREGAHPYTIASAWDPASRKLNFITKALGDHTARLHEQLKVGARMRVEGPYGCFTFEDASARQIWIGAGIGITPFVARMKRLAQSPDGRRIDFYHPTREIDPSVRAKLAADVSAAGVSLHLLVDAQDGQLDGARIRREIPDWQQASVWFCGPVEFADVLRRDLLAHGLPHAQFHQELFQLR